MRLTAKYGWPPQVIADLTPYQQIVYLESKEQPRYATLAEALAMIEGAGNGS